MSLNIKKPTDKDKGIVTLKITEKTRNDLRVIKSKNNYQTYDALLLDMIETYESFINRFLEQYINALNKCPKCSLLNTDECLNNCDVYYIFSKLEECQEIGNIIFKTKIRFADHFHTIITNCMSCPDLNTAKCINCEIRKSISKIKETIKLADNIFK